MLPAVIEVAEFQAARVPLGQTRVSFADRCVSISDPVNPALHGENLLANSHMGRRSSGETARFRRFGSNESGSFCQLRIRR